MQVRLEIDFFNPRLEGTNQIKGKDSFTLSWDILNNEASLIWLKLLYQSLEKDLPFFARFTGFDNSPKDLEYLFRKMNEAIEIINFEGHYPEIKERADGTFTQEFANVMHHHFELLNGDAKNPSPYYKASSPMGKSAISLINYCVHDMEAVTRVKESDTSARAVIFEVKNAKQYALPEEMFKDFSLEVDFGDLCLHYGLVGKTWWEVFLDEDEVILDEAIRPLDVIGPEFDIHLLPGDFPKGTKERFFKFLKEHGQDPEDPSLRLGFYPVAKLKTSFSKEEILREVGCRSGVKAIRLIKNDKLWIERDMQERPSCQEGFWKLYPRQEVASSWQGKINRFSNEVFIISGEKEGTPLNNILTSGEVEPTGHILSLMVPSDGKSVILSPSEQERGMCFESKLTIKPGNALHLIYREDKRYHPIEELIKEDN